MVARARHLSNRTEDTYHNFIKRYILFEARWMIKTWLYEGSGFDESISELFVTGFFTTFINRSNKYSES